MNIAIRDIRAKFMGVYVLEDEYTKTWAASDQFDSLPVDFFRAKNVTWLLNSIRYPLIEVQSPLVWDQFNQNPNSTADIPTHYYIRHKAGQDEIGLYPTPSSASDTDGFVLTYISNPPDLSVDDTALTVAGVINGDATVTHAAAGFTSVMIDDKRWLKIDAATGGDGHWYRLLTFTTTSSIELDKKYEGLTDTSVSLTVGQVPLLPKNTIPLILTEASVKSFLIYYAFHTYIIRLRAGHSCRRYVGVG